MSVTSTSRKTTGVRRTTQLVFAATIFGLCSSIPLRGNQINAVWRGETGNWSDGRQWKNSDPAFPNNGDGKTYDAALNSGDITLDRDITIQRFILNGGTLSGGSDLKLKDGLWWTGGTLSVSGTIVLAEGSISNFAPPDGLSASTFNNAGHYKVADGTGGWCSIPAIFNNTGSVELLAETAVLTLSRGGQSSGSFNLVANSSGLNLGDRQVGSPRPTYTYTLADGARITGKGSTNIQTTLDVAGNASIETSLTNNGTLLVEKGVTLALKGLVQAAFSTVSPVTKLSGGTIDSDQALIFLEGTLTGSGAIGGALAKNARFKAGVNIGGTLLPGTLTVGGDLTMQRSATLIMQIGDVTQGFECSHVEVKGVTTLGGNLRLRIPEGSVSQLKSAETITLLTSEGPLMGAFSDVGDNDKLDTEDGSISFRVHYGPNSSYPPNKLVLTPYNEVDKPSPTP